MDCLGHYWDRALHESCMKAESHLHPRTAELSGRLERLEEDY